MKRDKELLEEVGIVLRAAEVRKKRKEGTGTQGRKFPGKEWVLEGIVELYVESLTTIFRRLPSEMLVTIEDMNEFCVGIMTEETKTLLQAYYDEHKRRG